MMRVFLIHCLWWPLVVARTLAVDDPDGKLVLDAMTKATEFARQHLSVGGGYASQWTRDSYEGITEHNQSETVISIQPHGTTTLGLAFVRAFTATSEPVFLEAALETANALAACQLSSGGWDSDFDFAPDQISRYHLRRDLRAGDSEPGKRRHLSTLDDNKTQSALLFLIELNAMRPFEPGSELEDTLNYGIKSLLEAQSPSGAWPQKFDGPSSEVTAAERASFPKEWPRQWPNEKYYRYDTLNDGNLLQIVRVLIRAHDAMGDQACLAAAIKAGQFLIRAQLPDPQPAWAQQYTDRLQPAWARKFEPPALSSVESFGAIETLMELWIATGDEAFLDPIARALTWLEKSQLDDGRWARFYEMETNQPLYFNSNYELTYDDDDLPTHYGFKIDAKFGRKIERVRKQLTKSREKITEERSDPEDADEWSREARSLASEVTEALDTLSNDGYWVRDGKIDARTFVDYLTSMARYLEAVSQAAP
ncbi:MAG: pectate lyase [Verrucomicrobiota bacterium]